MFAAGNDIVDDFIGVKFGKVAVIPSSNGRECAIAVDNISVGVFFKLNGGITRMCVLDSEISGFNFGHFIDSNIFIFKLFCKVSFNFLANNQSFNEPKIYIEICLKYIISLSDPK